MPAPASRPLHQPYVATLGSFYLVVTQRCQPNSNEPNDLTDPNGPDEPDGTQAIGGCSYCASISSVGRYVAFNSSATDLVPGDANGKDAVFLHDRDI